jgi:predicted nucleic acid-binding protein
MPYVDAEMRREYRFGAWDRSVQVRERWMTEGVNRLETLLARFGGVVELSVSLSAWRSSIGLMAFHRLHSNDAIHAATAILAGVVDFATADDDFRRVPNFRLHLLRDPLPQP